MSKRRLICYIIALATFFGAYVGYKLHENRPKPPPVAKGTNERLESMNRAFLQRAESVNQAPREVTKRFPSLKLPVWTYTPEKLDSSTVDSGKAIALVSEIIEFHLTRLPDAKAYQLPLPEEKTLLAGDITSAQEVIYLIFTTPENTPEFPPPSLHELQIRSDVPIPYPLIAKAFDSRDDASLTQLRDWIESVGGAARAQSLLEAAGLSDSIRIETATIFRQ